MKARIVLLLLGLILIWNMSSAAEEQKKVDLLLCVDKATHYSSGAKKWGYCDRESGKAIIGYQFKEAGKFSEEGLAMVTNDKGQHYYIDATGMKAFDIPADVSAIEDFSEGLARIRRDGKYGYINNKGEIVIEPQFEDAQKAFKDGVARVKELINIKGTEFVERYGFIDKTGKAIIKPRFIKAQEFSDGLAMVGYIKGKKKIEGFITDNEIVCFIDKTGKEVITLGKDTAMWYKIEDSDYGFSDGLSWIFPLSGKHYAINKRGNIVFKDVNTLAISKFSEGLSQFYLRDNNGRGVGWVYIDKSGKVIIPPIYNCEEAYSFSDGMALISDKTWRKYGYINKEGKVVIKPQFDNAGDFTDGIAMVWFRGGGFNYIDKTGKLLWGEQAETTEQKKN